MYKRLLTISLVISVMAMSVACEKVEDNPLNGRTTAKFNPSVAYGTMTDKDGNTYKTVKIGSQTWMAENLRTTKYNDGTLIIKITDGYDWVNTGEGVYCNYNHSTNLDTIATYGRFYNLHAVKTGKLAPEGWHVPTDEEWQELIEYLGGESVAGAKLLEAGFSHWPWNNPTYGATNKSGFTALPGGINFYGASYSIGEKGVWWSLTEYEYNSLINYGLKYAYNWSSSIYAILIYKNSSSNSSGYSVRCVKD